MRRFVGSPWDPTPECSAGFDGAPVGNPLEARPKIVEHSEPGMAARRLRLVMGDFEAHGYTESCDGCLQLRLGRAPKNHNERCRDWMEVAIAAESEDGLGRVEAAYGRIAEAEPRRQERAAREAAPAPSPAPEPPTQPAPAGSQVEVFFHHRLPSTDGSSETVDNGQHGSSQGSPEGDMRHGAASTLTRE